MTDIGAESQSQRSQRFKRRIGGRLLTGFVVGALLGAIAGVVLGLVFFDAGGFGFWMAIVASVIFGTFVSVLLGGYSSLESPDPGAEPSDTMRPMQDRPEPTRQEQEGEGA